MIPAAGRETFNRIKATFDELAARHDRTAYLRVTRRVLGEEHRLTRIAQKIADGKTEVRIFWQNFEGLSTGKQKAWLNRSLPLVEAIRERAEREVEAAIEAAQADEARAAAAGLGAEGEPCPACQAAAQKPAQRLHIKTVAATAADRLPSDGPPAGRLSYQKRDAS